MRVDDVAGNVCLSLCDGAPGGVDAGAQGGRSVQRAQAGVRLRVSGWPRGLGRRNGG